MNHVKGRVRGFTLIELMVAVAVLGVIIAIAYPAYTDFVERGRRSEAHEALKNVATLQEQFYTNNKGYSGSLSDLGIGAMTENDHYQLSLSTGNTIGGFAQSYTVSATAQGAQASDTACATIQLDSSGNRSPADCW